ncbi:MAG: phosphoribosylformylglycinamidine synthase subunit PurS [Spirochaetota bacterium]
MFIGKISITLKESVLDPQGNTVKRALHEMGEEAVDDIRIGKYIEVKLDANDKESAKEDIDRICKNLLVNPVIESYSVEIVAV